MDRIGFPIQFSILRQVHGDCWNVDTEIDEGQQENPKFKFEPVSDNTLLVEIVVGVIEK